MLCGARQQPAQFLEQAEFIDHVGGRNIVPHVEAALLRAREIGTASRVSARRSPATLRRPLSSYAIHADIRRAAVDARGVRARATIAESTCSDAC